MVDGAGGPPFRADLAVTGDRVAAVRPAVAPGARHATAAAELDVTGRYLMPGFIDAHTHADGLADSRDAQLAALRQGVTTVLIGQDGLSYAPASDATITAVSQYFGAVNGPCPAALAGGCSVADVLAHYDGNTALNVACLAPAGTIRAEVLGFSGAPAGPRAAQSDASRGRAGAGRRRGRAVQRSRVPARPVRRRRRAGRAVRPGGRGRRGVREPPARLRGGRVARHARADRDRPPGRGGRARLALSRPGGHADRAARRGPRGRPGRDLRLLPLPARQHDSRHAGPARRGAGGRPGRHAAAAGPAGHQAAAGPGLVPAHRRRAGPDHAVATSARPSGPGPRACR